MEVQTIVGHYDSNTFIVEHKGTVVIIDAGARFVDAQKVLSGRKPDAILLTHEHFDHVYYLYDYRKQFDCPVYTPTNEDEILVGKIKVKPMLCPGHSPNSVVYLIEDCLFTGDVLFSNTIGRTDIITKGTKVTKKAADAIASINDIVMQKSLRRLLDVKFKTAYHGHNARYESSSYEEQQNNIRRFL